MLKQYRIRASLNKTDLAKRLGVTPSYVMLLESGDRKPPSMDRLREIVAILKLSAEESRMFINAAMMERVTPEILKWIKETFKI